MMKRFFVCSIYACLFMVALGMYLSNKVDDTDLETFKVELNQPILRDGAYVYVFGDRYIDASEMPSGVRSIDAWCLRSEQQCRASYSLAKTQQGSASIWHILGLASLVGAVFFLLCYLFVDYVPAISPQESVPTGSPHSAESSP